MKQIAAVLLSMAALLSTGCTTYIHGPLESHNLEKTGVWPGPKLTVQDVIVEKLRPQGFLSNEIQLVAEDYDSLPCKLRGGRTVEFLHSSDPVNGILGFITLTALPIAFIFPVWEDARVDSLVIVREKERVVFAKRYGTVLRTWYGLWAFLPGNGDDLLTDNPAVPYLRDVGTRLARRLAADWKGEIDLRTSICQDAEVYDSAMESSAE